VCCSVLQCVAVCCSVLQCGHHKRTGPRISKSQQHTATHCSTLQRTVAHCNRILHLKRQSSQKEPVYCIVLQWVAACCNVRSCAAVCCSALQCVTVCCSVLQCAAVCCSVLQCVAVCRSDLSVFCSFAVCCSVLQCVAVCCSVGITREQDLASQNHSNTLQHTATHCSALQQDITSQKAKLAKRANLLHCAAVGCSMLQCAVVCCSMLQRVAMCYNVLQWVAVCCSVLQCAVVCCSAREEVSRKRINSTHACLATKSRALFHKSPMHVSTNNFLHFHQKSPIPYLRLQHTIGFCS